MSVSDEVLAALNDFQGWRGKNRQFDLLDYVGCVATPDMFFGFLSLFEPELVLHDGEYFLASHFDRTTHEAWKGKLKDPVAIQKVMNHVHVSTLFQGQEVPPVVARAVAERIAQVWSRLFRDKG